MTVRLSQFGLILLLCLTLAAQLAIAEQNYCNDPKSWQEYEALVQKYPNDSDVQALHALRIGLCFKVERGDVTVEQATDIFESAREANVEKKKTEAGKSGKLGL